MRTHRLLVILLTVLSADAAPLTTALSAQGVGTAERPNIVFILADDLGFAEIGCNGSDIYQTPNIDALAKGGVRFSRFYTAPLCGPSRALILTGR